MKENYVYKDAEGEYYLAESTKRITLTNPAYPFSFAPETLVGLEEVGSAEEFGDLVTQQKPMGKLYVGESLNAKIEDNGSLNVVESKDKE